MTQQRRRAAWRASWATALLVLAGCANTSEPSAPIATVDASGAEDEPDGGQPTVEIRKVVSSTVGACDGIGVTARVEGQQCYVLGDAVDVGDWVLDAQAASRGDLGWSVRVSVDPDRFGEVRAAFDAAGADRYLLVADGRGPLEFSYAVLALDAAFGPLLSEREATIGAAALRGDPLPDMDRPAAGPGDVWLAVLGVHVCGEWLPNAPSTNAEADVHSHGDGLVYLHPEEGDTATSLGAFMAEGAWSTGDQGFTIWNGVEVREGDLCPDGRPGTFRWSVDGELQTGDPSRHVLRHHRTRIRDAIGQTGNGQR